MQHTPLLPPKPLARRTRHPQLSTRNQTLLIEHFLQSMILPSPLTFTIDQWKHQLPSLSANYYRYLRKSDQKSGIAQLRAAFPLETTLPPRIYSKKKKTPLPTMLTNSLSFLPLLFP